MTDIILAKLKRAFDRRGCTGLTIWVNIDGRIQANMRGPDGVSWGCSTDSDLEKALSAALTEFLNAHTNTVERKPKLPRQLEADRKAFEAERQAQPKRKRRKRSG